MEPNPKLALYSFKKADLKNINKYLPDINLTSLLKKPKNLQNF